MKGQRISEFTLGTYFALEIAIQLKFNIVFNQP